MQKQQLLTHEWCAIAILTLMMSTLFFTSIRNGTSLSDEIHGSLQTVEEVPYISVTILGAVEDPGEYQIRKGTLLKEVLEQAKPLASANLDRLRLEAPVTRKRKITLRQKRIFSKNRPKSEKSREIGQETDSKP